MSEEIKEPTTTKKTSIIKGFFNKLKGIKHIDIILTILFIAIILLIYFSTFSNSNVKSAQDAKNSQIVKSTTENSNTLLTYSKEVEDKLYGVISQLNGVGKVKVSVKLQGDVEYVYAYTTKVETLENGTKVETKTPILINENNKSEPLVLQTIMPKVESVVVVATGAKNTNVKLDILRVVELLYNLPSSKIEIFVGN